MKRSELQTALDEMDSVFKKWLFRTGDFLTLFPNESRENIVQSLHRHVRAGVLVRVCRGVYANDRARSRTHTAFVLARFLRPRNFVYLSREVRLQQMGLITQVYVDYISLMTDGRTQTFNTPYGIINYAHTERSWESISEHLTYNHETGLWEADEELATLDLRRSRNKAHIGMFLEEKERSVGAHAF